MGRQMNRQWYVWINDGWVDRWMNRDRKGDREGLARGELGGGGGETDRQIHKPAKWSLIVP